MRGIKIAIYFFLGLGPILLVFAGLWWRHYDTWMSQSVVTTGTVVSTDDYWTQPTRAGEMRERGQSANVEWSDLDGGQHTLVLYAKSMSAYSKGNRVGVRYLPSDPSSARGDFGTFPIGPAILGLMGLCFCGLTFKIVVIDKGKALPW